MSWSKIFAVTAVVMFVFGIATIDCAVAGEKVKMKAHGATFNVKWEQIEVGDVEGHVIGIYENKEIAFNEITGERTVGRGLGMMDINPKTKLVTIRGYGVNTDKDGDKMVRQYEGKAVGKGHSEGVWTYVKGTGKYEGIKGGGTWSSYSLAQEQSYWEAEGEVEMPTQ
jgi:hypothetical protein